MLPLSHSRRGNVNNGNQPSLLALTRKQDRPSMKSHLPYNGSADYYWNNPPPLTANSAFEDHWTTENDRMSENGSRHYHHPQYNGNMPGQPSYQSITVMPPPPPQYQNYPMPDYYGNDNNSFLFARRPMAPPPTIPNSFSYDDSKKRRKNKSYLKIFLAVLSFLVALYFAYWIFGGDVQQIKQRVINDNEFIKTVEQTPRIKMANQKCDGPSCEEVIDNEVKFTKTAPPEKAKVIINEMKFNKLPAKPVKVEHSWNDDYESTVEVLTEYLH